jgi:thiol:disulfide interchange protein DsbD
MIQRAILILIFALISSSSIAQILNPVKWSIEQKHISGNDYEIILTAKIDKGFHIFSQTLPETATPMPTEIVFDKSAEYNLVGKTTEHSKPHFMKDADEVTQLPTYEGTGVFKQKITVKGTSAKVSGSVNYMCCDDHQCLPPNDYTFEIVVSNAGNNNPANNNQINNSLPTPQSKDTAAQTIQNIAPDTVTKVPDTITPTISNDQDIKGKGLLQIFLIGFGAGLISLITPCVYSMIPLTVTFFTKQSGTRSKGITNALIYSFSIIAIFVLLGVALYAFGISGDSVNEFASNGVFNFALFLLFVVFAISFFGVFEITLPTSWINKSEQLSDKGGFIGIFFMAFTLVLVSFSCTAPFIGSALALITQGHALGPIVGMFAFSLALALPFGLFAFFPQMLKSLPKSGGWMNVVKVTFAFIELALALKFLSNVDLAYHWHLLDREIFLSLWIIIFTLTGIYLLGFIRFSYDSEVNHISVPRLFFSIIILSFAMYMVPGLWGAPLKAISAFAPPMATQDFDLSRNQFYGINPTTNVQTPKKYDNTFHCPHGLDCYFDYNDALEAAKKENKPLFIDFTGWSCVNCRKMEASVWANPEVLKRMREDYIIASLYVDDKTSLPESEQYISTFSGKKIKTLGNKNSDLQASKYNSNSQPYYVLLDHNEQLLNSPRGYNEDVAAYVEFLDKGIAAFKKSK